MGSGRSLIGTEVTNTLAAEQFNGIHRVALELLRRSPDIEPLRSLADQPGQFRRLTPGERFAVQRGLVPGRAFATRIAKRLPGEARRRFSDTFNLATDVAEVDVFLDIEAAWLNPWSRRDLLPHLHRFAVATAAIIHDVAPITNPKWFEPASTFRFERYLKAHLVHRSHFFCISQHTRSQLHQVAADFGHPDPSTSVLPMGALKAHTIPSGDDNGSAPMLLMVGTLEPRKNHSFAIDLFDRLDAEGIDVELQLVGSRGWKSSDLVARITNHRHYGERLRWRSGLSDNALAELYTDAAAVLVPSLDEGFGLPVIEALAHGTPVIASDHPALREAGGTFARYAGSEDRWHSMVTSLLDPAEQAAVRNRLRRYSPPSWDDSATALEQKLRELAN
ncbi:MAG: glycosyltransferase family 4 protein [Acidimicrobiales bacterium]|nr:glycosyltransferase family 4 protein [Acidimicrobiales bacterium]